MPHHPSKDSPPTPDSFEKQFFENDHFTKFSTTALSSPEPCDRDMNVTKQAGKRTDRDFLASHDAFFSDELFLECYSGLEKDTRTRKKRRGQSDSSTCFISPKVISACKMARKTSTSLLGRKSSRLLPATSEKSTKQEVQAILKSHSNTVIMGEDALSTERKKNQSLTLHSGSTQLCVPQTDAFTPEGKDTEKDTEIHSSFTATTALPPSPAPKASSSSSRRRLPKGNNPLWAELFSEGAEGDHHQWLDSPPLCGIPAEALLTGVVRSASPPVSAPPTTITITPASNHATTTGTTTTTTTTTTTSVNDLSNRNTNSSTPDIMETNHRAASSYADPSLAMNRSTSIVSPSAGTNDPTFAPQYPTLLHPSGGAPHGLPVSMLRSGGHVNNDHRIHNPLGIVNTSPLSESVKKSVEPLLHFLRDHALGLGNTYPPSAASQCPPISTVSPCSPTLPILSCADGVRCAESNYSGLPSFETKRMTSVTVGTQTNADVVSSLCELFVNLHIFFAPHPSS